MSPEGESSTEIARAHFYGTSRSYTGWSEAGLPHCAQETGIYTNCKVKDVSDICAALTNSSDESLLRFIHMCIQRHRAKLRTMKNFTWDHIGFWTHNRLGICRALEDVSGNTQWKKLRTHFDFLCSLNCRFPGCDSFACKIH